MKMVIVNDFHLYCNWVIVVYNYDSVSVIFKVCFFMKSLCYREWGTRSAWWFKVTISILWF